MISRRASRLEQRSDQTKRWATIWLTFEADASRRVVSPFPPRAAIHEAACGASKISIGKSWSRVHAPPPACAS